MFRDMCEEVVNYYASWFEQWSDEEIIKQIDMINAFYETISANFGVDSLNDFILIDEIIGFETKLQEECEKRLRRYIVAKKVFENISVSSDETSENK